MKSINNITKIKKYQHFTYEKRQKLEALLSVKVKTKEIAHILNCSTRTIQREIKRGQTEQIKIIPYPEKIKEFNRRVTYIKYTADKAQFVADIAKTAKGPREKIGNDFKFAKFVVKLLKQKYSPYAIIQKIKNDNLIFNTKVCSRTIYNYIYNEYFIDFAYKNMLEPRKQKKRNKNIRLARHNLKGVSITERPKEIEQRETFGHWEIDLVVGKRSTKEVLLTLVERKSRYLICVKLPSKEKKIVQDKIRDIVKNTEIFKTITADNGSEFLGMEEVNGTKIYYAHPYSSWERGSNERTNRIIRRFVAKKESIKKYSEEEIEDIAEWINNYPRKILNGKTPNELFMQNINNIVA